MNGQTSRALKIAADNEWQIRERGWPAPVELTPDDAKILFAAIKQLSGEVERLAQDAKRLDWVNNHNWRPKAALDLLYSINVRDAIDAAMRKDGE